MNPAVGPQSTVPTDDAASVALKGASLAFQKRTTPYTTSNHQPQQSSSTTSLSIDRAIGQNYNTLPPLHNQQHSLEHFIQNGALLAATSSVERIQSPGVVAEATPVRSAHFRPHSGLAASLDATTPSDVGSSGVAAGAVPPAGLVVARLQQLGAASTTASTTISPAPSAQILNKVAGAGSTTSAKLDDKSPSLIAATLAASSNTSPALVAARKSQDVDAAVDLKSIPSTNSLILIFEKDRSSDQLQRRISRTSPDGAVRRKSTRVASRDINKQTNAASTTAPNSTIKQKTGKKNSAGRFPSPSKAAENKQSPSPRRRPSSTVSDDQNPISAPSNTPAANRVLTPKTIAQAAASKPRMTPPKTGDTLKAKGQPRVAEAPEIIPRAKPSPERKITEPKREPSVAHRRTKQRRSTAVSELPESDSHSVNLQPAGQNAPVTPRRQSPTPKVISRSSPEVVSPQPTRVTKSASIRSNTPSSSVVLRLSPNEQILPDLDPNKRQMGGMRPPTPPKPRNSQRLVVHATTYQDRSREKSNTTLSGPAPVNSMWGLPIVSNTTANTPKPRKAPTISSSTSKESIFSAPPSPTHEPIHRRRSQLSTSHQTQLSSMANAIVAGSLASARLTPYSTGSSLPPPSLPTRQRSPHLLQTLRPAQNEPKEEEEASRQRRNHHHRYRLYGNKHTHQEGSRRRWRESLTERERKRYEALWASNRGLLLTDESAPLQTKADSDRQGTVELSECVANIVVRDIWKRSRLPMEELAEVWDLVDRGRRGYLTRPEFAVGMFLIDQRLRGHKLPPRVSDSIWGSVNGVTVSNPKARRKTKKTRSKRG